MHFSIFFNGFLVVLSDLLAPSQLVLFYVLMMMQIPAFAVYLFASSLFCLQSWNLLMFCLYGFLHLISSPQHQE